MRELSNEKWPKTHPDSNPGPVAYRATALATELCAWSRGETMRVSLNQTQLEAVNTEQVKFYTCCYLFIVDWLHEGQLC